MILLAFAASFRGVYEFAAMFVSSNNKLFAGLILSELRNYIFIVIPLLIIWRITSFKSNFYGLTFRKTNIKPYLWLILLVILIALVAAQFESFTNKYPMYIHKSSYGFAGLPAWLNMLIYEIAYGISFLPIELIFRGFLVIGVARLIGKEAILPMVVVYVFAHFQKPAGEAISSAIGGYLLGIFAFRSKNIWGGVIIHSGLAWSMELMAWLMKLNNN
jgi:hypothetical protein